MPKSDGPVLVADEGAVRVITLNRPARLNAFTLESYRELAGALAEAAVDERVHVVVIRGAGPAFSSGVDLKELAKLADPDELTATFDVLLENLASFPKPLLAAVHGFAVGIGLTLLLHCDLVLVAQDARLRAPFTELGTAPEAGSSWLLPQLIGAQRAADILLTSRWIDGSEAARIGLAARCCPPGTLHEQAITLAQQIATLRPSGVMAAKKLIRQGWADQLRAASDRENAASRSLRAELGPLGYTSDR